MPDLEWNTIAESLRLDEALNSLGVVETSRRNGEIWCACPLPSHKGADRSGSNFSVNEDTFFWNCFTCSDGGGLPALVQRIHGYGTWAEALMFLVEFSDADPEDDLAFVRQMDKYLERPHKSHIQPRGMGTLPYFSHAALEPYKGCGADLWAERGIAEYPTMEAFDLGYDPRSMRFGKNDEEYIGPALIIPHYWGKQGELQLVGYQKRWLEYGKDGFPSWLPKYTNSSDFPRKETIFNYWRVFNLLEPVVVVESVMTVLRLFQIGIPAMATFGGSTPDEMLNLLRTFRYGLILSCDNDDAGRKATQTILKALVEDIPIDVVPPVSGHKADLGDLPDDEIVAQIAKKEPGFLLLADT